MSKQLSIIKPTVGRKVWYRPSAHDLIGLGSMTVSPGQPLDATVVAVWSDRCVNVQVLDVHGKAYTKTSVTLKQAGDQIPADKDGNEVGGYVEWMPYQQGQAAKADAVDEAATQG